MKTKILIPRSMNFNPAGAEVTKLLSIVRILTLACLLAAAPATAQVNYAVSGNGTYAYVTSSPSASGDVIIASTFNGLPVTHIDQYAFSACTSLTSVTVPNSVWAIGSYAFSPCTSLTNVTILGGVGYLGQFAFQGCTSLRTMTIPYGLPRIELRTFFGCTSLTSVTIPNDVTMIVDDAFENCTSLTNVIIPDSVTYVGGRAFGGCTSLTSVTIGNATGFWGDAFDGCSSLTNFSVAASNPAYSSLDGVLFDKAQTGIFIFPFGRAGSYVIPNTVTGIGNFVFSGCTSLTSVTIPDSVTSIGYYAFSHCASLTSVTIGSGVTSIGVEVFLGSTSLTNLSVGAANPVYSSADGVLFNKVQTSLIIFPPGRAGSYVIPDNVTSIAPNAFSGCIRLTSVTFGDGVTNTGVSAFSGCTSLTSVTIPNNVTGIGNGSFSGCTSLASVTIPNSVTRIGFEAFMRCTNLANLTFLGNAPVLTPYTSNSLGRWFANVSPGAKAYYYCGTTGWGTTYGGLPTVMLCAPGIAAGGAGMKPGGFGFTLTGLPNQSIVVEASANLVNWQPIWTNTLSGASADFVDPEWLHHPIRFYRARSN